jgi:histone deacetylase complex regulatory component SIN3
VHNGKKTIFVFPPSFFLINIKRMINMNTTVSEAEQQQKVIQQKDALAFLDEIRSEFPNDNNKVFQDFINIMADFKSNK